MVVREYAAITAYMYIVGLCTWSQCEEMCSTGSVDHTVSESTRFAERD